MELGSNFIIRLSNVCDQEIFTYPLILVRGRISQADDCGTISKTRAFVINEKSSAKIPCRIFNDKFLVLLHLEAGKNEFVFTYGRYSAKKTFFYQVPSKKEIVTLIHIVCEDGVINGESVDIGRKINLGAQLIQTLIAESLYSCGFTRKTFLLEQDSADEHGNCLLFKSKLKPVVAARMTAEELWEYFGRELLKSEYASEDRKFLAFCTVRPNNRSKLLAIGGGGLALCDIDFIKTWPSRIDNINQYFTELTSTKRDFSNFISSIGAVSHELCHTFDLGHTINGVMGRDFNQAGLIFISTDNEAIYTNTNDTLNLRHDHNGNDSLIVADDSCFRTFNINYSITCNTFCDKSNACQNKIMDQSKDSYGAFSIHTIWSRGCASLLAYHRWINCENVEIRNINESLRNTLQYDRTRGIVTSMHGIIVVQLRRSCGFIIKSWDFKSTNSKKLFLVPIYEARRASLIVIEDVRGNLVKQELDDAF